MLRTCTLAISHQLATMGPQNDYANVPGNCFQVGRAGVIKAHQAVEPRLPLACILAYRITF